jgi:predicted ATP-dependent endonuclease of OLD family
MYIEEIIINHYKSIKDPIHLREFSGFHILVGPNNAGKTNVLDAINLFFEENLEDERFFDKDADIKMTIAHNGEKYFFAYKDGKITKDFPGNINDRFVRINENVNYQEVVKNLQIFKTDYPEAYVGFSKSLEKYFKGIEINEELFLFNIFSDNKTRSVKRMGDGFKRLFVILFYVFHPQYDIILIDEPEIHLHPSIIKKFLNILENNHLKNQIIFTTHHPSFIQAKYLPNIWRVARNENKSTALYGFYKKDLNLNRFVQEINDENSGMLFADKVLLVEGVSDAIFIREMINRFYKKETDIKVVYTSGKGSVDLYTSICDIFNIPYAIMMDNDAINSASLERVKRFPKFTRRMSFGEKIKLLEEQEIFILEKDLEYTYPEKYRNKDRKPLAALSISQKITDKDFQEKKMRVIKNLLEKI